MQALLVLDVNNDVVNAGGSLGASGMANHADARELARRIAAVVAAAREEKQLVVWSVPGAAVLESFGVPPSSDWGLTIDVRYGTPRLDEPIVVKQAIGAFTGTDLEEQLRGHGVDKVVLCGVATSFVVTSTAQEALERGLSAYVVEDCCADVSEQAHAAAIEALPPDVVVTHSAASP